MLLTVDVYQVSLRQRAEKKWEKSGEFHVFENSLHYDNLSNKAPAKVGAGTRQAP